MYKICSILVRASLYFSLKRTLKVSLMCICINVVRTPYKADCTQYKLVAIWWQVLRVTSMPLVIVSKLLIKP